MSPYVEDLVKRMRAFVEAERRTRGEDEAPYHQMHPATLIAEAMIVIQTDERLLLDLGKGEFIR